MSDEDKRVAIVTGGSRGIGRAICVELAKRGYYIVINYHSNEKAANETLGMVKEQGAYGEILGFDVSDNKTVTGIMKDLSKRLPNVEVLVNNAGVTADGLFPMMSYEHWNKVLSTTLDGFYNLTKPVIRQMMRKHKGSVISISSVSALIGNRGQSNYAAAKAGLLGATRALASEVARLGIRVNAVAPGLIDTDMIEGAPVDQMVKMIPMQRLGKPEEVAKLVAFLCSDDAAYITGQVISINGGML